MRNVLAGIAVAVLALAGAGARAGPSALTPYRVVWAPTQQIVFVAGGGDIYVLSPSGGSPRLLTRGEGDMLSVARDGRVLYTKDHRLLTIPLAGGTPRSLGLGSNGVWSPDGKRIVFLGDGWFMVEDADGRHRGGSRGTDIPTSPAFRPGRRTAASSPTSPAGPRT